MSESDEVVEEEIQQLDDIEALQTALAEEKERAENYLGSWQRCQADLANFKKRAEQDKAEIIQFASSALVQSLLPVLDDFERAFGSAPAELAESNWTEGVRLIYNKLKAILEAQGLTEIEAKGEPFDPRLHEAVMQQEGEEGLVIEETQKGYRFKDKMLRPSLVVVGRGITKRRSRARD
ncbi:MAG: nucleotide exchange factor GrpE [Dehalococcoidia bacterium]|nr:nucleotide exchange factor GrpE [Dehalococcoidia bacterium]